MNRVTALFFDQDTYRIDDRGRRRHYVTAFGFITFIVVGTLTLFVFLGWGANGLSAESCYQRAAAYGITDVDYGIFSGCVVVTPDGYRTDIDNYLTVRNSR